MLGVLIVLCALLGLAIGSFLNVVIYRVPLGMSVVSPRFGVSIVWDADRGA